MKFILISTLSLMVLVTSCSRFNVQEHEAYQEKRIRHGLIPLETYEVAKKGNIVIKLDAASVKRGEVVYQQNCIKCHGPTGEGSDSKEFTPPLTYVANLKKAVNEVESFDFYISISNWKGTMPGWKNLLTEENKKDVANYIKTFASQPSH